MHEPEPPKPTRLYDAEPAVEPFQDGRAKQSQGQGMLDPIQSPARTRPHHEPALQNHSQRHRVQRQVFHRVASATSGAAEGAGRRTRLQLKEEHKGECRSRQSRLPTPCLQRQQNKGTAVCESHNRRLRRQAKLQTGTATQGQHSGGPLGAHGSASCVIADARRPPEAAADSSVPNLAGVQRKEAGLLQLGRGPEEKLHPLREDDLGPEGPQLNECRWSWRDSRGC